MDIVKRLLSAHSGENVPIKEFPYFVSSILKLESVHTNLLINFQPLKIFDLFHIFIYYDKTTFFVTQCFCTIKFCETKCYFLRRYCFSLRLGLISRKQILGLTFQELAVYRERHRVQIEKMLAF
jgi:hypothetical protein